MKKIKVKQTFIQRLANYINSQKSVVITTVNDKKIGKIIEVCEESSEPYIVLCDDYVEKLNWHIRTETITAWGVVDEN